MTNRYAVLISARNEENVIGNLIGSIRDQTYPSDLIDIWLVADNCTDNTADRAFNRFIRADVRYQFVFA